MNTQCDRAAGVQGTSGDNVGFGILRPSPGWEIGFVGEEAPRILSDLSVEHIIVSSDGFQIHFLNNLLELGAVDDL